MKRTINPRYFDNWGTLDKYNGDGGDSCAYFHTFYALVSMGAEVEAFESSNFYSTGSVLIPSLGHFNSVSGAHHVAPGVLVRHPDANRDASDWDRMSRDQITPALIAWGRLNRRQLARFALGHLKRAFLFANNTRRNGATKKNHGKVEAGFKRNYDWKFPDLTLFSTWALFIRGLDLWLLYPLLIIFDIPLLVQAYIYYFDTKQKIVTNFSLQLIFTRKHLPTPFSYWAMRVNKFESLADRIIDHLDDFGPNGIKFLGEMFKDAYRK